MRQYAVTTTVEPTLEPVTLDQARQQCRVEHSHDDPLIGRLITAARQMSEQAVDRRWVTQTVAVVFAGFPECGGPLELPVSPVQTVSTVTYRDAAGDTQTLTGWEAWEAHHPPLIAPPAAGWPATESGRLKAVTVTAVVGHGTPKQVPAHAAQAMLLAVGYWYGFRGDLKDAREAEAMAKSLGMPTTAEPLLALLRDRGYR